MAKNDDVIISVSTNILSFIACPREIAVFTLLLACTNGSLMTVRLIFYAKNVKIFYFLPAASVK